MNLSNMSINDLRELDSRIGIEIKSRAGKEIEAARQQIAAIAKSVGLSPIDFLAMKIGPSRKEASPAHYRHPTDASITWSGKGRVLNWIKEMRAAASEPTDLQAA